MQDNREGQINLNTSEWLILSKIDGQRSIKDIAAASGPVGLRRGQDPLRPVATGLIRLRDPGAGPARGRGRRAPRRRAASRCTGLRPPSRDRAAPRRSTPRRSQRAGAARQAQPVRDVCNNVLGTVGESVVNKHYLKAEVGARSGRAASRPSRRRSTRSRAPRRS